jgi:hypothetical protein
MITRTATLIKVESKRYGVSARYNSPTVRSKAPLAVTRVQKVFAKTNCQILSAPAPCKTSHF